LLQRIADEAAEHGADTLYRDAGQPATTMPGAIPEALLRFAREALAAALKDPAVLERALGEYLTEPKPNVWFEAGEAPPRWQSLVLDPRTRMLHDRRHVFINGEAWRAAGADARLMRRLADRAGWTRATWPRERGGARTAAIVVRSGLGARDRRGLSAAAPNGGRHGRSTGRGK